MNLQGGGQHHSLSLVALQQQLSSAGIMRLYQFFSLSARADPGIYKGSGLGNLMLSLITSDSFGMQGRGRLIRCVNLLASACVEYRSVKSHNGPRVNLWLWAP